MNEQSRKRPNVLGWCAVAISVAFSCFWAFWGIIENFHEGWYRVNLASNLALMIFQYLSAAIIFVLLSVISILRPRIGVALLVIAAASLSEFFHFSFTACTVIVLPLLMLAALYWYGRPQPRRRAVQIAVGLPLITLVISGAEPAWRSATRIDDGYRGAREIDTNGVHLVWAPQGPGWPLDGKNWYEANRICSYLTRDGVNMAASPQNIWRLPTVEEAARSMARHGVNCGGAWDAEKAATSYRVQPDKESPLWNVHSKVIYWWTATEIDSKQAYMIVYDGKVWARPKRSSFGYLGFRAVKSLER